MTAAAAITPQQAVDELLAADRTFSAASAKTDLISGLAAMFADDVVMPNPGGLAYGSVKAVDVLRANPVNTGARTDWVPVRGAISADGQHGFTFGFMTLYQADGAKVPLKYLSYWRKQQGGWKVLAFKRARRAPGEVATTLLAPLLPGAIVAPTTDAKVIAKHRESLGNAERAFSNDAQSMGIGAAFTQYGSADAMNMGGPELSGFLFGNVAIGDSVGAGAGGESGAGVSWGPENVFVASSGDLGVSIGYIVPHKPGPDGKPVRIAFFTIWRRASATDPWRYVAE
ncbi:MAG: nuclear transport factor 2 family protein [Vicinamibacterales bacterium]